MSRPEIVDGSPTDGDNPWIDSLVWGGAWREETGDMPTPSDPVEIEVALGQGFYVPNGFAFGAQWFDYEVDALRSALQTYETFANIDFVGAQNTNSADIRYYLSSEAFFEAQFQGQERLGAHDAPGYPDFTAGTALGIFNYEGEGWSEAGLQVGGYGYRSILQELGHGLGLAHPHDGGSADDASVFPGVGSAFDDLGMFELNQGIYTVMSFNDPLVGSAPTSNDFGWVSGPMALDIYALQLLYGANTTHATGDDVYVLPQANAAGTYWSSIWDAGGTDTISAEGSLLAVTIDLDDADLTGEFAAGRVSQASGILGGFTIANGAMIENAVGGDGSDILRGNELDNVIEGRGGADSLFGEGGDDELYGGDGDDRLFGGRGNDTFFVDAGDEVFELEGQGNDTIVALTNNVVMAENVENLVIDDSVSGYLTITGNSLGNALFAGVSGAMMQGGDGDDILTGNLEADDLSGGDGDDILRGLAGNDILSGDNGNDTLEGDSGEDTLSGGNGNDFLDGGSGSDVMNGGAGRDRMLGDTGDDVMEGGGGNDDMDGGASNDELRGGAGNDEMLGGTGMDFLAGGNGRDVIDGGSDTDILLGGGGADVLDGGTGADAMTGGGGNDTYVVDNTQDEVTERGGNSGGIDTVISRLAFYSLASGVENMSFEFASTPSSVTGVGNGLDNRMEAFDGADTTLRGQGGSDQLIGGDGDDTLQGDGGRDRLVSGKGDDTMSGGSGADTFFFRKGHGDDTITDFNANADVIEIGKGASRFNALDIDQVGSSVEISLRGATLTLLNTDIDDVTRDVFEF